MKGDQTNLGNKHRLGKKNSDHQKRAVSEYMKKNNPMKRPEQRARQKQRMLGKVGEQSPRWDGGRDRRPMSDPKYVLWRLSVLERDQFICQGCGAKGVSLYAHHILPWSKFISKRYDVGNGLSVCLDCHYAIHHPGKKKIT